MKYVKKYQLLIYILFIICASSIVLFKFLDIQRPKSIVIERKPIINSEIPTKEDLPTIDFETLRKKYGNKDIKGAIRFDKTNFEKIVFQSKNNEYYFNHNYRGKKNGNEIFIDYRLNIDTSKVKIIYSKNIELLKSYYDKDYYNEHKYIELETDKSIYKYEIISISNQDIEYNSFDVEKELEKSFIKFNSEISKDDEYLIFKTYINNDVISIISKKVI